MVLYKACQAKYIRLTVGHQNFIKPAWDTERHEEKKPQGAATFRDDAILMFTTVNFCSLLSEFCTLVRYFIKPAKQKVRPFGCRNIACTSMRHIQIQRKHCRMLQLSGTLKFYIFPIIFFRCIGDNAETLTYPKLEHFPALLPTTRKNDWRCSGIFYPHCGQQRGKHSAWWAKTWKSCNNAEQYNIFCEPPYL